MYLSHFAVIFGLHHIWPLPDGLVSLLVASAALNYLVARATWHLIERRAQDLAHRLTSSAAKPAPRAEAIPTTGVVLGSRSAGA
jgi:exopolysaccharide production protein ExoZ